MTASRPSLVRDAAAGVGEAASCRRGRERRDGRDAGAGGAASAARRSARRAGPPLAEYASELDIADGPERVLEWVAEKFEKLLATAGQSAADVRGIGVGVPGPVEF